MSMKTRDKLRIADKAYAIVETKQGDKYIVEMKKANDDLVVNAGLNFYQQRSYSSSANVMSHGAVGTGTNTPQASDTTLQTEILRKSLTVTTNPSTGVAHFEFVVDYSEANGNTLTEVGVFNAASSGTMLLRKLFASGIPKTSDKKITIIVETTLTAA